MSCAEVLIRHVDDGNEEEDSGGDDVDNHLVSQRATCCFAESGSAFVNWELKVPESDQDDAGGKLAVCDKDAKG